MSLYVCLLSLFMDGHLSCVFARFSGVICKKEELSCGRRSGTGEVPHTTNGVPHLHRLKFVTRIVRRDERIDIHYTLLRGFDLLLKRYRYIRQGKIEHVCDICRNGTCVDRCSTTAAEW